VGRVRTLGAGLALEQLLHLTGHELRLGALVVHLHDLDRDTPAARRPQVLAFALAVVGDDRVGDVEDRLRRAVVLLQTDHLGVGIVALELKDVADVGAAPRVDGLVVVADHGQVAVLGGEEVGEAVLGVVRVLVLVDEDVAEGALVVTQALGDLLEELDGAHEQVVEVHGVHRHELLLVKVVDVGRDAGEAAARLLAEGGRVEQLVLGVRDLAGDGLGRVALRIVLERLEATADEAALVVGVVDRERAAVPETVGLAAQDAGAHRVEGADPHRARDAADEALDALLHLARGLVREGDGEDLVGARVAGGEQIRDAMREHTGLARAGPGEDEQRAVDVGHGRALRLVEAGEQARHGGRKGFAPARPRRACLAHTTPRSRSRLIMSSTSPATTSLSPESTRRSRDTRPRKTPRAKHSTMAMATLTA